MNRHFVGLIAAIGVLAGLATAAQAQYVTYYTPVTTTAYYAPAAEVVVTPAPAIAVAPPVYTVASPVYTVASPVVVTAAAPVVAAPVPVVTYYRAPAVAYARVPQVVTRYRPILGGSVSRVRYSYMPVLLP